MTRIGFEAIYHRWNTSKPATGYQIFPYSLRKLAITPLDRFWVTDIGSVPMSRGFVYLVASADWFIWRVLT